MTDDGMALFFVADYARAQTGQCISDFEEIFKQFTENCVAVFEDYNCTRLDQALILTMDRVLVGECLSTAVRDLFDANRRGGAVTHDKQCALTLVADLIRGEQRLAAPVGACLREAFEWDRILETMTLYRLAPVAKAAFVAALSGNPEPLAACVAKELVTTPAPQKVDLWCDQYPRFHRVAPSVLLAEKEQRMTIVVDCACPPMQVHLVSNDRCNHIVSSRIDCPTPVTFSAYEFTAIFDLVGTEPGEYFVRIYLSRQTPPIELTLQGMNDPSHLVTVTIAKNE